MSADTTTAQDAMAIAVEALQRAQSALTLAQAALDGAPHRGILGVRRVPPSEVVGAVATEYNMPRARITGRSRRTLYLEPRRVVARILHDYGYGLADIGTAINRHHTSVMDMLRRELPDNARAVVLKVKEELSG